MQVYSVATSDRLGAQEAWIQHNADKIATSLKAGDRKTATRDSFMEIKMMR